MNHKRLCWEEEKQQNNHSTLKEVKISFLMTKFETNVFRKKALISTVVFHASNLACLSGACEGAERCRAVEGKVARAAGGGKRRNQARDCLKQELPLYVLVTGSRETGPENSDTQRNFLGDPRANGIRERNLTQRLAPPPPPPSRLRPLEQSSRG